MARITHHIAQGPAQQQDAAALIPAPPAEPVEAQPQANVLDHHGAPGNLTQNVEAEDENEPVADVVAHVHVPVEGISPLYYSLYGFLLGN